MPRRLSLATSLLLVYWLTRLHNLTALPGFFDEAVHIRWAKLVWALQPFHAASDGRLLNIWAYAAFFPFGAGLFVARAVTVLAGLLGFAALLKLGQRLFSRRAVWLAGLIYVAMPYALFYDRMALADSFAAPLLTLALLAATQASEAGRRPERARPPLWPLVAGALLAALILTKLTDLLFAPLPLLVLLLHPRGEPRGRAWARTATIYGAAALVLLAAVVMLKGLAQSDLGFDLIAARTEAAPLAERLLSNARALWEFAGYLSPPITLLAVWGLVLAPGNRGALVAAGLIALPAGALLAGSNVAESRFLAPILPMLALVAGYGASRILDWLTRPVWRAGALGLFLLALAAGSARFTWQVWRSPGDLPLTAWDRFQYVEEWPAGFGLRETAALVFGPGAERPLDVVVSDEGHIPQLSLYAPWEPGLHSLYAFDDGGVRLLHLPREQHDPFAGLADPARPALYVVEVPRYEAERNALAANLTLLARFPRPGGKSVIEVYRLEETRNP
jgi:4-amino-4-deoxy-L-arabinose transferase-like glycosyltransferase